MKPNVNLCCQCTCSESFVLLHFMDWSTALIHVLQAFVYKHAKKWCYVWEKRVKFSWLLTSNQLNANSTSRFFVTFSQNYVSCLILIALTKASTPTLCSFVHPKLSKRRSSKIYVTESSLGLQRNRNNLYRRVLLFNLVSIL